MRHSKRLGIGAMVVVFLMSANLVALPSSQGKGKSEKAKNEKKADRTEDGDSFDLIAVASAGISITYGDARALAEKNHLTGYKPLPPGIRKNLARGKPMPPGIAKTRLPASYLGKLPAHEGYEWQVAGTDLVLVFRADLTIAGVLKDVFQ